MADNHSTPQHPLDWGPAPQSLAQPAPAGPKSTSKAKNKPKLPSLQEDQGLFAVENIAKAAAPSTPPAKAPALGLPTAPDAPSAPADTALLLAPAEFRHPQAQRQVWLGDAVVAYALHRARRRSIGFTVGADGLSVRAPVWVTPTAVDAAVQQKADWILRKLREARERQQRTETQRLVWANGATLPYLGQPLLLLLDPAHRFEGQGAALCMDAANACADAPPNMPTLRLALAHTASPAQIRDAVQAWLMRAARQHFTERLEHFAPLLGVRWTSLRLSSAQTRWGSARVDGAIRLNWRLLHFRPAIIDYVVAHELAHLRVMDHSPKFWDTVATVVPDHRSLRQQMRTEPAPGWD